MKMKFNILFVAAALLSGVCCSQYDDSDILNRLNRIEKDVDQLKKDVAALQRDAAQTNSDIQALKTLIEKIQENADNQNPGVSVVEVKSFSEDGATGWIIVFSDGDSIKIYNGRDSVAPVIGTVEIDGVLYWTIDGEPVMDPATGRMIPVTGDAGEKGDKGDKGDSGITPKLKVEGGYWYVSYDNDKTWIKLGPSTTSPGGVIFRSVQIVDGNIVFTLSDGTVYTLPLISVEKSTQFDENNIVLSLAAISDTHIGNSYGSEAKLTSALTQLKNRAAEKDADGLDAVMVVGDLVNTATNSQISTFKTLYEGVLDPVKVPMIYTIGNHDMNPNYRWTAETVSQNSVFHTIFGDNYFLTDLDQDMRKNFECRHCVVGDYHILCVTPNGTSPIVYDANTMTWLNKELKEITDENPNQYVIVLTHPMIYDTVYGSLLQDSYTTLGDYWSTKALSGILEGYPQAVTFGGHLHFPLNDPRSIWQGKFTALGCASTSYMAIDNGAYEGMASATVMKDAGEYSQGLLVQFDANGFMRLTRMDFYHNTIIGQVWEVNPPATDNSHLDKYNHTALKSANTAPSLSEIAASVGTYSDGKAPVTVSWAAGTDDEFVHHYVLGVKKGSATVATKKVLADFYRAPQPSMMKSEYTLSLGDLEAGTYTLSLVAWDSWDAASAALEKEFTVATKSNEIWVNDSAGSKDIEGGSGSVSGSWLSYSAGKLSWTANTSGKPRKETITLPNGENVAATQLDASDFKGTWSFRTQRFSNNTAVTTAAVDITFNVSIVDALYGETLADVDGNSYTNNLGLKGLYLDAVADIAVVIDYEKMSLRLGLFLDERKAQGVSNGNATYPYVCFIPELGSSATAFGSPWTFVPVPVGSNQNYTWLWFDVSSDFNTLNYDCPLQKLSTTHPFSTTPYIIGITCAVCKNAAPAASDIFGTYNVIYQANPNKAVTNGGFTLKRQ